MQDNISVIIATIIAVIIIVLFPIYNIATRQDSVANNMVVEATTNFVDKVRSQGYVDAEEYGKFLNELDKTGNTYKVEMEVYKPIFLEVETEKDTFEEKYEIDYTEQVLAQLNSSAVATNDKSVETLIASDKTVKDTSNIYYLNEDYKFYVRVKNTNITQAQLLFDRLFGGELKERVVVNYGGIVYSNEWAKGENAEIMSANISISRPMYGENDNLKEYKYESIAEVAGGFGDDVSSTMKYAIAVRLSDATGGKDEIKFVLKYKDVEKFGSTPTKRKNHILNNYFEIIGFEASKKIEEISANETRGEYEYIITLSNINYDFVNNPYVEGSVRVKSGSANTKFGAVAEVNSKEFVIFYKLIPLEIELSSTPDVFDNNVISPSNANITFTAKNITESENVKLDKVYFEITNNDVVVKTQMVNANQASQSASISYSFEPGVGTIKAYGIDSRGNKTETIGTGFVIMNNYLEKSINTNGVTEMETVVINGARISSFEFYVRLPSHSGSDWWRVSGKVGNTNEWVNIYPKSGETSVSVWYRKSDGGNNWSFTQADMDIHAFNVLSSSNSVYANGASFMIFPTYLGKTGSDANTYYFSDLTNITQLKFEYRTDPSHDGSSCLRGGNISYRVQYKFED